MFESAINQNALDSRVEELYWLQKVRAGDELAIHMLVDRHRMRLIRVATNILRDSFEAEDVAQEAFVRGFRELKNLRDDRAFSGYLYKICVRLCMDRLRSKKPKVVECDQVEPDKGSAIENKVLVQALLDQLSYDLRTTLVLREVEQLSYEEVAGIMNVPVGTVRSRLHTARERFRELWVRETRD